MVLGFPVSIIDVFVDFETRSKTDIKKAGGEKYSRKIDRLLCMAYRIGVDSETKLWKHGDPPPQDLFDAIQSGSCRLNAFNAAFEEAVWRNHCVPVLGWVAAGPHLWHCSAARSRALALPGSLGMTGNALKCKVTKDEEGRAVMLQLSKPRKPSKDNPSIWFEDEERLQKLYAYCISDVDSEVSIWKETQPLRGIERDVWLLDQEINRRGVKLDRGLVASAVEIWKKYQASLNKELSELTLGVITRANQRQRIEEWLKRVCGIEVESLDKEHLPQLLKRTDLPDLARRVLEIRQELAVSSVAKFQAMLDSMCDEDDRARGVQLYCGASQTGRWAGRLIQTQNITRGVISYKSDEEYWHRVEDYIAKLKEDKFEIHKDQAGSTTGEILSSLIRPAICADTGKKLIVCDYSKVELCGNGWVADQKNLLEQRRNNEDPYKYMAAEIYHMDPAAVVKGSPEYQLGKAASLGCFGADTMVVTDSGNKRIVDVTTEDKLWDGVEWVAHEGLLNQGVNQVIDLDGISVTPDHEFLSDDRWVSAATMAMRLPAGLIFKRARQTYDIHNAGPRHRFTIISPSGDRYIVHNCGYGMGAAKFYATCQKFGLDVDEDLAKRAVDTFRTTYDRIRTNWYETEDTAKQAIHSPGTEYKCPNGKISYVVDGKWLFCVLPSGRRLAYMNPRIEDRMTSWGESRPTIVFEGYEQGQWQERTTYSGKLVENYIQATTRDLLASSMLLLDMLGAPIIFHVHDEAVTEVKDDDTWTISDVEKVMSILPKWAKGFPLAAEGFESYRYKK